MVSTVEYKIHDGSTLVRIVLTEDKKTRLAEALIEDFYKKYECHSGEQIMQNDDCQIEASVALADILDDILEPEVESL